MEKVIFVNDAYARYLGKNKEELLGGPHIPNLEAEEIPAVSRSIRSLSKDNPAIIFECRIHHDCGKDRWNLWTVRVLFDDENKPAEYQGIGRDNTEKRRARLRRELTSILKTWNSFPAKRRSLLIFLLTLIFFTQSGRDFRNCFLRQFL